MRLRRLLLENYGCFERVDLPLATEPGRITLVIAPNGAGKSVLRHAFHDLLFDIPPQSPMKFRYGYKGMRLHAEAVARDGAAFEFGWTRGANPQRVTNDPARFAALRAEATPQQLEQLFALDTARLRQGGLDLKGGTTLAGALLSGTGELAPARRVQAEIDARRAANWGQGKSKPVLNAAAGALAKAQAAARQAVQRPQFREQQEKELDGRRAAHKAARQALADAQATARRLHRIALVRPHLDGLAEAQAWFQANPAVPALPPELEARLADARGTLAQALTASTTTASALRDAEQQAAAIQCDEAVGLHRDELDRLPSQLGKSEGSATDIETRRNERRAALDSVVEALRDIGADVPPDEAARMIPPAPVLAMARAAITSHAGLMTVQARETRELAKAKARLAAATANPVTPDTTPDGLAELLLEVRADRNPVQHATACEKAERVARATLDAALAKVPGWTAGAPALRALAPPLEADCERLDATRRDTAQEARAAATQRNKTAGRLAQLRKELQSLQGKALPDDAAIAAARATRDRGWRLIATRLFAGAPDEAGERDYAGAEPMPLVFQRHLESADRLADQRIADLEAVEHVERLAWEIGELEVEAGAAQVAEAAAQQRASEALAGWRDAVAPLGLGPSATMADVRLVLAARLQVVDAMHALDLAAGEHAAVTARHHAWAARMAALLDVPVQTLPALLGLADARTAAAEAARQARTLQAAETSSAEAAHRAAGDSLRDADARLASWEQEWVGTLAGLGRPAGERPAATASVLDRLGMLDKHARDVIGFDRRIDEMQGNLDSFGARVATLAADLGEQPAATPFATARNLIARDGRAAAQDSALKQAQATLRSCKDANETAAETARRARDGLGAVVAAAGATDEAGAAERIAASREYIRHAAMRDQATQALREHGDGLTVEALRQEVLAVPAEAMQAERARADDDARAANDRAEQAAVELSTIQARYDADAEATTALSAAAEQAGAASLFARLLEEQLVLDLAASMLGHALKAVERNAGDRGLARISGAFGAVTDGAYGVVLNEEDGQKLMAVEHRYPNERKQLDQLSEGTRDQLFLALRMVALREHAASAAPLPFVADDILQTFDDARATAALGALVSLSAHLQVIVLTHHRHLTGLAGAMPGDSVQVREL